MRRILIGFAMSLATTAASPVAASGPDAFRLPAPIWSGMYAGLSVGFGTGDSEAREINGTRTYIADFDGAVGGVYVGWQKQWQRVVAGLEVEAGYLGLGSSIERDVAGGSITSGADLGAFGSISGRLGVLVAPEWLVYGRVGLVAAHLDARTEQACSLPGLCGGAQTTPVSIAESSNITWGLLLGAGVERHLFGNWTGRLEYQYINFRDELALPAIDGPGWKHDVDVHAVKFGLSYRF